VSTDVIVALIAAGPATLAALAAWGQSRRTSRDVVVAQQPIGERMVRVETKLDAQGERLARVEEKLDRR
jgi:hypothetical protein